MFCNKCGKIINEGETLCEDCKYTCTVEIESAPKPSRITGLKKSIISAAFGETALMLAIIAMALCLLNQITAFVLSLIACALITFSVIYGVQSIKCFVFAKNNGHPKPIATLICGILGPVFSVASLYYLILTFLICVLQMESIM